MDIQQLERQRKSVNRRKWLLILLFLVIWIPIALLIKEQFNLSNEVIRYLAIPLMLVFYGHYTKYKRGYVNAVGKEISEAIVKKLKPQWRHQSETGLPLDEIFGTFLIKKQHWVFASHLMTGEMDGVDFQFCHVETSKKNSLTGRMPQVDFRGYFFVFDFPKFATSTVHVHPPTNKDFGSIMKIPVSVKTDSLEFEIAYKTYSDDPVQARYILSLALMSRMIDLQAVLPGNVSFCFREGKVYVALKMQGDTIEPKVNKPIDMAAIEAVHSNLFGVMERFVTELRLQLDIWKGKEA